MQQHTSLPKISSPKVKTIIVSSILLLILVILGIAILLQTYLQNNSFTYSTTSNPTTIPTPTPDPFAPFNILLLGYGGFEHSGGQLTDTMLITHIRPKDKTITLISLPRDLWVPLSLDEATSAATYYKINHAFALGNDNSDYPNKPSRYSDDFGGLNLAKDTVQTVTGLPIKNAAAISFYSFTESLDTIGGVDVYVPVTFDDEFYPIKGNEDSTCDKPPEQIEALTATLSGELLDQQFSCRYEKLHFDAGLTHMDGATALKFVRSRHSKQHGGDFGRSQRQQALLKAVKDKVLALNFVLKIYPLIQGFKTNIYSDITANTINDHLNLLGDLKDYQINTLNINTQNVLQFSQSQNGQSILVPKDGVDQWQSIHAFLHDSLTPKISTNSAIFKDQ